MLVPTQNEQNEQRGPLQAAIAGLEAQRALLGDAVVETALVALHRQLAAIESSTPPAPPLEGEFKLVTILFADITGFTTVAEKLGPEQVRSLMNACFETLVPVIENYQGVVDKFIGDAIMALFGAPVAQENHPEQALRAALEMRSALEDFNRQHGTDFGLHFGVNTGRVVAGGIGSAGRQDYSVMGDAVNVAARLEDASARGEILVGPDTYRLTEALFDFESLPPLALQGKNEPVAAYRLGSPRSMPGSRRGVAGLRSPLVGRDSELECLREACRALAQGTGGAIAIVGEAGLGKSRLVAETRAGLPQGTITWAEGRALSYTGGMSYFVAREVLRALIGIGAETPPAETETLLYRSVEEVLPARAVDMYPYLARLLEVPLEAPAMAERVRYLSPEGLQQRILQTFRDYVRARGSRQPLVLVWEDLHWADPSSLTVLEALLPLRICV